MKTFTAVWVISCFKNRTLFLLASFLFTQCTTEDSPYESGKVYEANVIGGDACGGNLFVDVTNANIGREFARGDTVYRHAITLRSTKTTKFDTKVPTSCKRYFTIDVEATKKRRFSNLTGPCQLIITCSGSIPEDYVGVSRISAHEF